MESIKTSPVARRIRLLRSIAGWSDRELAERTGVFSREQVEARLTVNRKPTAIKADEVQVFSDALGVPVDLLYLEDDGDFFRKIADLGINTSQYPDCALDLPFCNAA